MVCQGPGDRRRPSTLTTKSVSAAGAGDPWEVEKGPWQDGAATGTGSLRVGHSVEHYTDPGP